MRDDVVTVKVELDIFNCKVDAEKSLMESTIEDQIRAFLVEQFVLGSESDLPPNDESLTEAGVVDSAAVLTLVLFLEETFGITVDDEEVRPENLDSVTRMADFVREKLPDSDKGA